MKKVGIICVLMLLISSLTIMAQADKAGQDKKDNASGPKLRFDCGSTYDWGDVKYKDSPLKCSIKIFNDGNEPLKITKVKPGCGCTKTSLDKDEVAPGDFAVVELKLNLKDSPGKTTKSVTFYTNETNSDKTLLFLKANVLTGYSLNPARMNFYNAKINEEITAKMVLENTSSDIMTIDELQVRPDDLIISGLKKGQVLKPGEVLTIEAKYTPTKPGNFHPNLNIFIKDNPDVTKIQIMGTGKTVEPEELKSEEVKKDEIQKTPIKVK